MKPYECPSDEMIQEWLDNRSDVSSQQFIEHSRNCKKCQRAIKDYKSLYSTLNEKYKPQKSYNQSDSINKIMAKIALQKPHTQRIKQKTNNPLFAFFASLEKHLLINLSAALAVCLLLAVFLFSSYSKKNITITQSNFSLAQNKISLSLGDPSKSLKASNGEIITFDNTTSLSPSEVPYELIGRSIVVLSFDNLKLTFYDSAQFVLSDNSINLKAGSLDIETTEPNIPFIALTNDATITPIWGNFSLNVSDAYTSIFLNKGHLKIESSDGTIKAMEGSSMIYILPDGELTNCITDMAQDKPTEPHMRGSDSNKSPDIPKLTPDELKNIFEV